MQSGETRESTIAPDGEIEDPVQRFIQENTQDEKQAELYKGYRKYEKWADKWVVPTLLGSFTLLVVVGLAVDNFTTIPPGTVVTPGSYLMIGVVGILFGVAVLSLFAQFISDMTMEKIAYHELASSFETYRNNAENIGPVCDRISTALDYIDKRRFHRIDQTRLSDSKRYLEKIDEADKNEYIEEEFHATFPRFMAEFSDAVASPTETELSQIAKDMDSAYTGETPMTDRLREDIGRLARLLFTGSELIITGPLIVLSSLAYFSVIEVSSAIGIFGVIFAIYAYYENR